MKPMTYGGSRPCGPNGIQAKQANSTSALTAITGLRGLIRSEMKLSSAEEP